MKSRSQESVGGEKLSTDQSHGASGGLQCLSAEIMLIKMSPNTFVLLNRKNSM